MSGSLKGKLATPLVFSLAAAVVIGGMTWATIATYKLAKDEHLSKVRIAIWRMEKYLGGILAVESSRPYTDYLAYHRHRAQAVIARDGRNMNWFTAILPSPLLESGPPHDWIELYFQADESGNFSSPQLPRGQMDWNADPELIRSGSPRRALDSFRWLKGTLTSKDLAEQVATDIAHKITQEALAAAGVPAHKQSSEDLADLLADFRPSAATEYELRIFSKIASQMEPPGHVECEAVDILNANIQNIAGQGDPLMDSSSPETRINKSSWTAFWRESDECQCMKMVFVRVITRKHIDQNAGDETVRIFYQGFIADWDQLKPKLLAQVKKRLFTHAELLPVTDDKPPSLEASEFVMSVPVRLSTPEMAGGVSAAAWRSVGGVLVMSWIATLSVLALSGWGVWSLVALTQRRMRFAYAVTHELRTPLTTFRLYSDMLAGGLVPEDSKQEYLDTLDRESQRLSKLVEGVLEYSRIENQKVRLCPVKISGAALLATLKQELDLRCEAGGIESECVNRIAEHDHALIDVDVVNQIAGVLINNACRHARESESPFVRVELSADGSKLCLDVMDSGPGVDRKDARTIFKPFRRGRGADAAARGGIGLGLALARSWAKLLGGSLELVERCHPKLGGAHFRLKIPAKTQATSKRPADDYPDSDAIPA